MSDIDRKLSSFARILEIMDTLREKCPWDREQTMLSLRNNTIEETFELTEAITGGDFSAIKEELGDLLLHIVFYSKIAQEQGQFDISDVIEYLCDKLVYRHPHVYGAAQADDSSAVLHNWEALKLRERSKKDRKAAGGVLSGVPTSLPAMVKAFRISEKASSAGFDWPDRVQVWNKVKEEIAETEQVMESGSKADIEGEMGDIIFALVNAARLWGIDPENALERTNRKFMRRFSHIEKCAALTGRSITELTLDEMDEFWEQAKKEEI